MCEQHCEGFPAQRVSFPGPFMQHDVVVDGWRVPLISAQVSDHGRVLLVLDDRFALDLSVEEAERLVPFVADAMAVALGYDAHPSEADPAPVRRASHPRPQRVMTIAGIVDSPQA